MAISFVAQQKLEQSGVTSTQSFTVSAGTNRALVVQIANQLGATVSSVTYNGTALTFIATTASANNRQTGYTYISPPTGTANLVVTFSSSVTSNVIVAEYNGTVGGFESVVTTNSQNSNPISETTTAITNNQSWMITGASGQGPDFTALSNCTRRSGNVTTLNNYLFDSNATIGLTAFTMQQTTGGTPLAATVSYVLIEGTSMGGTPPNALFFGGGF